MSSRENPALAESCRFKVVYVYRITGTKTHEGLLKIGDASLKNVPASKTPQDFPPNCEALKNAARERIKGQTATAGIFHSVEILYAEIAVKDDGNAFRDYDVHRVLNNSGIESEKAMRPAHEWFRIDLETAKAAIAATKSGKSFIREISPGKTPITLRDEQKSAVRMAKRIFRNPGSRALWNAKMRFGKTLSALQLVKEMEFTRTIIVTHRPAVEESWFEDFDKIFYENDSPYIVGGRSRASFETLERERSRENKKYVYFASMQDLRGSEAVAGTAGFDKNLDVFKTDWDCVIIDEVHEGTQTSRGQNVLNLLRKKDTRTLSLSGTPFNVIGKYKESEIFTWDYCMEQKAKQEHEEMYPGAPNPYAALPRMNIRTYELGKALENPEFIEVEDKAFSFSEFFRVGENGKFVHERDVKKFLDLLAGKSENTTYYPFANDEYRAQFRHSFWFLPGTKEAACLEKLLQSHDVFGFFKIVNVAGDGNTDEDDAEKDALSRVKSAVKSADYTITLSCRRLTTGVTVPEWTAVLYLAGGYKTSPAAYMQTIFRVQSPGSVNGRVKEECYVFDFAPDRTLAIIEQVAQFSAGTDKKAREREKRVREFIVEFTNFAPVIAYDGSETRRVDSDHVMREAQKLCIAQVVRNGFASPKLWNNNLWHLTDADFDLFKNLENKIGKHAGTELTNEVVINDTGLPGENASETSADGNDETNPPPSFKPQTPEEEKERRKKRENAIAVLTNAAVRVPLLVFGADGSFDKTFSSENFTEHFDDKSWAEFMGKLTKEDFKKTVAPYLEETVFSGACSRIRERVYAADKLPVRERLRKIVEIHSEFKNPDKETVLTPWRVVNAQLSETLGGYKFFDIIHSESERDKPLCVSHGNVTEKTLGNPDAKILELNSKSGLYPLFVAYSLMLAKFKAHPPRRGETAEKCFDDAWFNAVADNIFVVCKTKMAEAITRRTLVGFKAGAKTNILVEENIVELAKNPKTLPRLAQKIKNPKTWNLEENTEMKFNAIVGNPPYQDQGGSGGKNDAPIYHHFVNLAHSLSPDCVSLIIKAAWFSAGRENLLGEFRKRMLANKHIQKLFVYSDAASIFPSAEIKGGICYFLENASYEGNCEYSYFSNGEWQRTELPLDEFSNIFIRNPKLISIVRKVLEHTDERNAKSVDSLISPDTPFGIPTNPVESKKTPFPFSKSATEEYDVRLYYVKNRRMVGFVRRADIRKNIQDIDKIKVLIPNSGGSGSDKLILSQPEFAPQKSGCSQSYLYATFESEYEAKNFISYYKTKFFRVLVSAVKITQHAFKHVYRFVPVQDFSKPWTDAELYEKYKLTDDEIAFIESMIRPM